jgi:hypothetical protein
MLPPLSMLCPSLQGSRNAVHAVPPVTPATAAPADLYVGVLVLARLPASISIKAEVGAAAPAEQQAQETLAAMLLARQLRMVVLDFGTSLHVLWLLCLAWLFCCCPACFG